MRFESARERDRIRAVSDQIEILIEQRGRVGPVDELKHLVLESVPHATERDFAKAFRRLHLSVP